MHQRTTALQYAGFEGLQPYQVNTMTNHMLEKQHSAYQSVTEKEVHFNFLMLFLHKPYTPSSDMYSYGRL